ncbi:MAG TPA: indole-3-glycerol phosphate synthase TrpC [Blastocatellia bacterium]|nr:indole-3-glycerol phosphate synthase TrpC [Blastocatellia bacterium]
MTAPSKKRPEGTVAAGEVLDRIIEAKAARLAAARIAVPLERMIAQSNTVAASRVRRSLAESLLTPDRVNIIAEIKHRSPSKGVIREDFDPVAIAEAYEEGGAAAMSVLAEEDFFGGSLDHIKRIRPLTSVPLLRKDFVFDEYQMHESVAAGADAVLLIVAVLDDDLLARLLGLANRLGLDALVEAHTADEMRRAHQAGARIIGVNNRDLARLKLNREGRETDLETSFRLAELAPPGAVLVSESGINSGDDIRKLKSAGFNGFLIGEHFMRATDPGFALRRMIASAND